MAHTHHIGYWSGSFEALTTLDFEILKHVVAPDIFTLWNMSGVVVKLIEEQGDNTILQILVYFIYHCTNKMQKH